MSGLHIVYGVMGGGKTNYVVNEHLRKTKYKRVFCNVPLAEDFKASFDSVEFNIYPKLEPLQVISLIDSEHPQSFFIVDESQLVLTSLNVAACKDFAKRMTQIRQDDQEVFLIAQSSKLLPNIIKGLAKDCYKCENKDVKGKKGYTKITHYKGGESWSTQEIESFEYKLVYGNYETSNWEDTEPPKDMFIRTKLKLVGLLLVIITLFALCFFLSKRVLNRHSSLVNSDDKKMISETISEYKESFKKDGECYRSFTCDSHGICYYINGYGQYNIIPIAEMGSHKPCSIQKSVEGSSSPLGFPKK